MAIMPGDTVHDLVSQEQVTVVQVEGQSRFALSNGEVREIHEIWKVETPQKRGLFGRKK